MAWPEIDYVELPNGRTIAVCAPHQMVTCGKCCLDFSFDCSNDDDYSGEDGDTDDDELFGYDFNSPVPRDVSVAQVAGSRYGRSARPASELLKADGNEDVGDNKSDDKRQFVAKVHGFRVVLPEPAESEGEENVVVARPFSRAPEKTRHSGIVFASKFDQQRATFSPEDLFPAGRCVPVAMPATRFINCHDTSECLIYTDGACFDNGAASARGGCAFVFKPVCANDQSGSVAFKLEDRGPDGRIYRHTSNRAELRAVIAALRFRAWDGEGFRGIVIATDSTYVVNGATDWTRAWIKKGWRLTTGEPVKNRDLWEALLLDVEKLHDRGVKVRFWKIPRQYNHLADRAAKNAASIFKPTKNFTDIIGCLV